jgi:opacity protein-like surface antigen
MKRVAVVLVIACAVLVLPGTAGAEFYLGAYGGVSIPHEAEFDGTSGAGPDGDVDFSLGAAFGGKAGYFFDAFEAPFVGLELDFNAQFPELDEFQSAGMTESAKGDVTVLAATGNVILRNPKWTLGPYVGGGIGWFYGKVDDFTRAGVPREGDSDSAFGWQLLAGVRWGAGERFSVFLEYRYMRTEFDLGGDIRGEVDFQASQVYGGVAFHF